MFKILETEVLGETLNTKVLFNLNGKEVETVVSHFRPESMEKVLQNLENREASELAVINFKASNEIIKQDLDGVKGMDSVNIKAYMTEVARLQEPKV